MSENREPKAQAFANQESPPAARAKPASKKASGNQGLLGMRVGYLLASWGVIVPFLAYQSYAHFGDGDWQSGIMLTLGTLLATQLHRITLTPQQTEQTWQLAQTEDVNAVGQLVEALEWPDDALRQAAAQALTRLLPRLTPEEETLLTSAQRECLHRMLTPITAQADPLLVIAILKALAQVGDSVALYPVQRLAGNGSVSPAVKSVAEDCLSLLQQREAEAQLRNTLLRPSTVHTPSEMLLRPASGNGAGTAPEQLLRPGSSPDRTQE